MEEKYIKWATITIFVCGGLILIANYAKDYFTKEKARKEKEAAQRENAMQGEIVAPESKPAPHSQAAQLPEEMVELKIGGMTCAFKKSQFEAGVETPKCLQVGNTVPVIIKLKGGKLFISTKIFDKAGKMVCEIDDNEWTVNKNNFYKRNYDSTAVEVIDQYDNIVLSAEVKNKNSIHVYGILNAIGQAFIFAYGDVTETLEYFPQAIKIIEQMEDRPWDELYREKAKKIPRVFLYNGKDYLGKRVS